MSRTSHSDLARELDLLAARLRLDAPTLDLISSAARILIEQDNRIAEATAVMGSARIALRAVLAQERGGALAALGREHGSALAATTLPLINVWLSGRRVIRRHGEPLTEVPK